MKIVSAEAVPHAVYRLRERSPEHVDAEFQFARSFIESVAMNSTPFGGQLHGNIMLKPPDGVLPGLVLACTYDAGRVTVKSVLTEEQALANMQSFCKGYKKMSRRTRRHKYEQQLKREAK